MKRPLLVAIAVCGVLLAAGNARAQNGAVTKAERVEITPNVALGSGGTSGIGTAVRWPLAGNFSAEVEVTQRYAEMNALGTSVNLLYDLPSLFSATPYVATGIGLEQYGFMQAGPGGSIAPRSSTAVTVNAGGGVRVPVDDTWGVRTDVRWFNGLGQAPERWRVYNGVTFKHRK